MITAPLSPVAAEPKGTDLPVGHLLLARRAVVHTPRVAAA
jgi:hypothetical protein